MLCAHKDDSEGDLGLPVYEDFKFTVSKSYGIHAAAIYIVPINDSACILCQLEDRVSHYMVFTRVHKGEM